ncbi:hypothetical protein M501DRAFT_948560 [Patellaria atrata CBS 101060]|uniref:RNA polymerase II assembly factor Rtp1 C-terminal domain-containing protein n=1 Tax=Patellaria atrata CBS 101060 TaxID=1346257 RepID=A0A9P4VU74_9PEZI|nr:hypothetical protein M501DRAFT_948560 [Patellaria atrata CBS 101060]
MVTLQKAIQNAEDFLHPLKTAKSEEHKSLINCLATYANTAENGDETSGRTLVLSQALELLQDIHNAIKEEKANPYRILLPTGEPSSAIFQLLDLLVLEGIIPFLSLGVAVQRRPTTALPWISLSPPQDLDVDEGILRLTIDGLLAISRETDSGLEPVLRDRIIADLIAGSAELSFFPRYASNKGENSSPNLFQVLLDITPTATLMLQLTHLLQQQLPDWLRPHLSKTLSLLPLRPRGVRTVISFIAASHPLPPAAEDQFEALPNSQGPPLPLEALQQATKLLSSVPSSMNLGSYYSALALQLWELLDGGDGPEMARVAAHIIGSGILGRRSVGAPGKIGWVLFADPIIGPLNPSTVPRLSSSENASKASLGNPIVDEPALALALKRFVTLVTSHPNPGLTKRLVGRTLLPLWGLLCYSKSHQVSPVWAERAELLLSSFIRLGAGLPELEMLTSDLLWDGTPQWMYSRGSDGGIEIRLRSATESDALNIIETMNQIDKRMEAFTGLLSLSSVDKDMACRLFTVITKRWLLPKQVTNTAALSLEVNAEPDPLQTFANAKLVQVMLEQTKDKFAENPIHILELVKQLLEQHVENEKYQSKRKQDVKMARYAGLSSIVQHDTAATEDPSDLEAAGDESIDLITMATSILTTITTSKDFSLTPQTLSTLSSTLPLLTHLTSNPSKFPRSVLNTVNHLLTTITALTITSSTSPHSSSLPNPTNTTDNDTQVLRTALQNLTSPLPPIRVESLHTLHNLIKSHSPVLPIPTLTTLLISTGLSDPESYVHLYAIKTLVALTIRESRVAGPLVVDALLDPKEEGGLDVRLRLCEAATQIVEGIAEGKSERTQGRVLVGKIGAAVVAVASRRGRRPRTLAAREKAARVEDARRMEREEVLGEAAAALDALDELDEDGNPIPAAKVLEREQLSRIVQGWADVGLEEDVRVRASAIAVLAKVAEVAPEGFTTQGLDQAAELCIAVLVLETKPEKAILRRAAVLVFLGVLRAMDKALEEGREVHVGLEGKRWEEVEKVLKWVRDEDQDDIVKGHAGVVREGLEDWRMKRLLGIERDISADLTPRFGLEGRLRGLGVDPEVSVRGKRVVVEEIED